MSAPDGQGSNTGNSRAHHKRFKKHSVESAIKSFPKTRKAIDRRLQDKDLKGFLVEDDLNSQNFFKCKHCRVPLTAHLSALRRHAKSKLHEKNMKIDEAAEERIREMLVVPNMSNATSSGTDDNKHQQPSSSDSARNGFYSITTVHSVQQQCASNPRSVRSLWIKQLAQCCMEEGVGFSTAIRLLKPKVAQTIENSSRCVSSAGALSNYLPEIKQEMYDIRKKAVKEAEYICLIIDDTPAVIHNDAKHVVCILATSPFVDKPVPLNIIATSEQLTGTKVSSLLQEELQNCGMELRQLVGVVSDNAKAMLTAATKLDKPHFSCISHTIHLVCQRLIEDLPILKRCISKLGKYLTVGDNVRISKHFKQTFGGESFRAACGCNTRWG